MDVALWTGDGVNGRAITGLNFSPDFVWIKNRSNLSENSLFDTVRGAAKTLYSNQTAAELASSAFGQVNSFDAAGFTLTNGSDPTYPNLATNFNGSGIVGWAWDAGTSTVSNTQGSITSQVRANATAGFSVVTWTGNGQSNATVGHGLGVAPSMIITVSRDGGSNWNIFHQSLATNNRLFFTTSAAVNVATTFGGGGIGSGTSTVLNFTQGTSNVDNANANNVRYVAYVFSGVVGHSSFGSYTGNGSSDGPFIYTGFRPKFFMHKDYTAGGAGRNWLIWDAARETYNAEQTILFANLVDTESANAAHAIDFVSNGIKIRNANVNINPNGVGFVYMAFAESPFNYSRAR
jgi:hypothetical protein